jgi:hypothetical protein
MLANALEPYRLRFPIPLCDETSVGRLAADGPFSASRSVEVAPTGTRPTAQHLVVGLYLLAQAERAAGPPAGGTFEHCALSSLQVVLSIRGNMKNSFISTAWGCSIDGQTVA